MWKPMFYMLVFFFIIILTPSGMFSKEIEFREKFLTSVSEEVSISVVDFDKDEDNDILCVSSDGNHIYWYKNISLSDATEYEMHEIADFDNDDCAVAINDIDNDKDLDFIVTSWNDNAVYFIENKNDGTFETHTILSDIYRPSEIIVADINKDWKKDIVVYSYGNSELHALYQNKNFGFSNTIIGTSIKACNKIIIQDINNDANMEIICSTTLDKSIHIFYRAGSKYTEKLIDNNISKPEALSAIDFNQNGYLDIVCIDKSENNAYLYLYDGVDEFTKTLIYNELDAVNSINIADIDNDGIDDLIFGGGSGKDSAVTYMRNIANNKTNALKLKTSCAGTNSVDVIDIDNDGDLDIIFHSNSTHTIAMFENIPVQIPAPILNEPANNADSIILNISYVWAGQYESTNNYHFMLAEDSQFQNIIEDSVFMNLEVFNDNDTLLNYSSTYYWKVRQIGLLDTSTWSQVYKFTTEDFGPVVLRTPENNEENVSLLPTLYWRRMTSANSYNLEVSENADMSNPIIEIYDITSDNYQIINQLSSFKLYYWRVQCINSKAEGIWSEIRSFTTGNNVAVNDNNIVKKLTIAPNPAPNQISIRFYNEKNINLQLAIFNSAGELVKRTNEIYTLSGDCQIIENTNTYSSGIYYLRIYSGGEILQEANFIIEK